MSATRISFAFVSSSSHEPKSLSLSTLHYRRLALYQLFTWTRRNCVWWKWEKTNIYTNENDDNDYYYFIIKI